MPAVKSPLGIIALFVSLIEAFLAIPLTQLQGSDRTIVVIFVTSFPVFVASLFFVVLWYKPLYLYDPSKLPVELQRRVQPEAEKLLEKAASKSSAEVKEADRSQVMARAERLAPLLQGARILWVDDSPENTLNERGLLSSLGVIIDPCETTDDALTLLKRIKYDLVISDMSRAGIPDAGTKFLSEMLEQHLYKLTIFYVDKLDKDRGTPAHAFAITNRPDHLIHYILDALERVRARLYSST